MVDSTGRLQALLIPPSPAIGTAGRQRPRTTPPCAILLIGPSDASCLVYLLFPFSNQHGCQDGTVVGVRRPRQRSETRVPLVAHLQPVLGVFRITRLRLRPGARSKLPDFTFHQFRRQGIATSSVGYLKCAPHTGQSIHATSRSTMPPTPLCGVGGVNLARHGPTDRRHGRRAQGRGVRQQLAGVGSRGRACPRRSTAELSRS